MKCIICNSLTDSFLDSKSQIEYFECKSCQFIIKSKESFVDFKEQKKRYDLHENSEDNLGYKEYFNRFLDFILNDITEPKLALDFGCGATSLLSKILNQKGIKCDFYDPIYYPDNNHNKKYDLIISVEVFEHIHKPKESFKYLVDRLNPNGYLAIQTAFYPKNRDDFLNWYYKLDPTHIIFFSPNTFTVLAKEFGLEIIKHNSKNMILMQKVF
jgi:2-polyprenyl-3-methyl-5-hydroxy-6-metoxy-1,4-benzoquinol methylase